MFDMFVLMYQSSIPVQPMAFQGCQDFSFCLLAYSGRIKVINSQEPLTVSGTRVKKTGDGDK